jgi:plastocyanin
MKARALSLLALLLTTSAYAATEKYIAAAARARGANNTFFLTELRVVNVTAATLRIDVAWLPSTSDNSQPVTVPIEIAARASKQIDDVVQTLFALSEGSGALRLSASGDFVATSRTYTTSSSGCPGTFGQFIPATDSSAAAKKLLLPNVRLSAATTTGFRSNVGAVNTTASTSTLKLTLRNGSGASLGEKTLTLAPFSHTQQPVAALFEKSTTTDDNLFLEIDASQPVLAYLSVVDNASADPIFIPASVDSGIPTAAIPLITARQWFFEPSTIEVTAGKPVTLQVRSLDIDHGIAFSGVGAVSCSSEQAGQCVLQPNETVTITFTPTQSGSFAFFCTRFCGASPDATQGHATMRGTIVVK